MEQLTAAQRYYYKRKAKEAGIPVEQYLSTKGTSVLNVKPIPSLVEFDKVVRLGSLNINEDMLKVNRTGLLIDEMISYERGIPVATNIMVSGDPGVGKTTVLLHTLSYLQNKNPNLKCLFISAEMGKKQMYAYTKRFPIMQSVETIFMTDYLEYNSKDVIEQLLARGYDYVLMDSMVEVLEAVKEDNSWSTATAEKWLLETCSKNNEGNNTEGKYTTFFLIQQVTKAGIFVGSNKVKHMSDAHMELKRQSERDGGGTYIMFTKNRNGNSGLMYSYQLTGTEIYYGTLSEDHSELEFELTDNT